MARKRQNGKKMGKERLGRNERQKEKCRIGKKEEYMDEKNRMERREKKAKERKR